MCQRSRHWGGVVDAVQVFVESCVVVSNSRPTPRRKPTASGAVLPTMIVAVALRQVVEGRESVADSRLEAPVLLLYRYLDGCQRLRELGPRDHKAGGTRTQPSYTLSMRSSADVVALMVPSQAPWSRMTLANLFDHLARTAAAEEADDPPRQHRRRLLPARSEDGMGKLSAVLPELVLRAVSWLPPSDRSAVSQTCRALRAITQALMLSTTTMPPSPDQQAGGEWESGGGGLLLTEPQEHQLSCLEWMWWREGRGGSAEASHPAYFRLGGAQADGGPLFFVNLMCVNEQH